MVYNHKNKGIKSELLLSRNKINKLGLLYKGERMSKRVLFKNMYLFLRKRRKRGNPSNEKCKSRISHHQELKIFLHNRGNGEIIPYFCVLALRQLGVLAFVDLDARVLYRTFMTVNYVYCFVMPLLCCEICGQFLCQCYVEIHVIDVEN